IRPTIPTRPPGPRSRARRAVRYGGAHLAAILAAAGCASSPRPAPSVAAPAVAAPGGWGADPGGRAPGPLLVGGGAPGGRLDLFGTMHTEPLASLPKIVGDRYAAARTVAFEADVENVNVLKLMAAEMLPLTQSLDRMVGPEAWQRIVKYLGGQMPEGLLKRF